MPIELPDGATVVADFLWPDAELVAETDGHQSHGTRRAFERDRRRDRRLAMLGHRVIRFTWLDVVQRPKEVSHTIATLLQKPPGYAGRSPDSAAATPSPK